MIQEASGKNQDVMRQTNILVHHVGEMIERGDLDGARLLIDEALLKNPESSRLKAEKGKILELSGCSSEAEDLYWSSFEPAHSTCPESFLYLASLKMNAGDIPKSHWILEKGLELFPSNYSILLEAAIVSALLGKWWLALDRLNALVDQDSPPVEAIMAWGSLVTRLGLVEHYPELISRYRSIADRNPSDIDSRILYVRALETADQKRKALKEIRALEKIFHKSPVLLREMGRVLMNNNEYAQAIDSFRRVLDLEGDSASLRHTMAMAHKLNGKPLAALESIGRAVELDPEDPDHSLLMGQIILDMGELDRASSIIHQHQHAPSYRNLGDLYLQKKRWEQAIEAYTRGFELRPTPETGEEILRLIEKKGGDPFVFMEVLAWMDLFFPKRVPSRYRSEQFLNSLLKKSGSSGDDAESIAIKALATYFRGKTSEAIPLLEKVVTIDPLSEVLFWILSLCYEMNGNIPQAIESANKVYHHSREPVTLFYTLGRLHKKKGAPLSEILALRERFITHHGPKAGFFRVMTEFYLGQDQWQEGIECLKEGMERSQENISLFPDYQRLLQEKIQHR
ncbi:MAG: tetratricopeptide repeat protein [Nitrospiraceae bacterium]|jgi:tetratricopeptide (TPR) repeat protein|nr:tetratricopeptide repeat protein [Nitrospiraceae bacterium]